MGTGPAAWFLPGPHDASRAHVCRGTHGLTPTAGGWLAVPRGHGGPGPRVPHTVAVPGPQGLRGRARPDGQALCKPRWLLHHRPKQARVRGQEGGVPGPAWPPSREGRRPSPGALGKGPRRRVQRKSSPGLPALQGGGRPLPGLGSKPQATHSQAWVAAPGELWVHRPSTLSQRETGRQPPTFTSTDANGSLRGGVPVGRLSGRTDGRFSGPAHRPLRSARWPQVQPSP